MIGGAWMGLHLNWLSPTEAIAGLAFALVFELAALLFEKKAIRKRT
jgi:hypothetical protein